jgi:hypothetical protein
MALPNTTTEEHNSLSVNLGNLITSITYGGSSEAFQCISDDNADIAEYENFVDKCLQKTGDIFIFNDSHQKQYAIERLKQILYNKKADRVVMHKLLQSEQVLACLFANEKLFDIFYNNIKDNKISDENIKKLFLMFSKNQENSCANLRNTKNLRPIKDTLTYDRIRCLTDTDMNDMPDQLISNLDKRDDAKRKSFHKRMQDYVLKKYYNNQETISSSVTKASEI